MPIANCVVAPGNYHASGDLVELWSDACGMAKDDMTVNVVTAVQQFGQPYAVMATLYLPSVWSLDKVNALQLGLATALAQGFNQAADQVHIVTLMIESGFVATSGQIQYWTAAPLKTTD